MAIGSVAPVPLRLRDTEQAINGKTIDAAAITAAKEKVIAEIQPIDDIRSTALYRTAVAGNLVTEFLEALRAHGDVT
jgi:CO/xanthine dehydrogenase FAD-binding subunit